MEKAIKRKKLYTALSIATFVIAVLLIIPVYFMYSQENYVAMIPFAVAMVAFCYANVFLAFAAYDTKEALRIIPIANELGCDNIREIASRMGWRRISTRKFITKCKKHGYIK